MVLRPAPLRRGRDRAAARRHAHRLRGDAAFAYVNAFTAHVNVGFFCGAALPDPAGLLEGSGRFMRHVKLRPGRPVDAAVLQALIDAAYADVKLRLTAEAAQSIAG